MNQKYLRYLGILTLLAGVGFVGARLLVRLLTPRPDNVGVRTERLAQCPSYPACVSSQALPDDEAHYIAPLVYAGPLEEARDRIIAILEKLERTTIVVALDDYVYAESVTPGLRYTDDVEFTFDDAAKLVHVRSSARVPYYDFEVNRQRVEAIRAAFAATEQ